MTEIKNRECPACKENGHDSNGDHLFLMGKKDMWYCHRADYHKNGMVYREKAGPEEDGYIANVSGDTGPKPPSAASFDSIGTAPPSASFAPAGGTARIPPAVPTKTTMDSVEEFRGVPTSTFDFYGFQGAYDSSGIMTQIVWDMYAEGKVVGQKWRTLPKDFKSTALKGYALEFTGQHKYRSGGNKLLIVEGEHDMCAAQYMLNSGKYKVPVVSLPIGADKKALQVFKDQAKWLKKWKKIVICFDEDDVGTETTRLVYGLMNDILVMDMSEKDAGDMLTEGKEAEFVDNFYKAESWKPAGVVAIKDLIQKAIVPIEWGLSYPFSALTKMTYGSRGGQIVCIVGAPGSGKSTFIQQLQMHFIYHHNEPICIFDLENPPELTLRFLIGKQMNQPIHLPDCSYNQVDAEAIAMTMEPFLHIYDHSGYRDWGDIIMYIRYLHAQGVTRFFIDPLSALVTHLDAAEANKYISGAMMDMSKLIQEKKDIQIFHINHANNGTGRDAGAGGRIYGGQISGSRSQWRFSTDVWTVERDQTAEEEAVKSSVLMRSIKNRMAGNTGSVQLQYDKDKGLLIEPAAGEFEDMS